MFSCTRPFKLHTWGKWQVVGGGERKTKGSPLAPQADWYTCGRFLNQSRTCADCGLVQEKITKS